MLLSASTASGKTEAAFFPILTLFSEDPPSSVGAIYIGPLKGAHQRPVCAAERPLRRGGHPRLALARRRGAVAQGQAAQNPSGILQITPESLEALLLHKHMDLVRLFGDLRFIVIDEVHALMRGDRGGQTLCLIERLSKLAGVNPRRIGLSATIGDPGTGALPRGRDRAGHRDSQAREQGARWRLSMEHFYITGPQAGGEAKRRPARCRFPEAPTDVMPEQADPGMGYIFEHTRGKKCLIFVNSREECEAVTTTLRQYCEYRNEPDRFLIHHGNLSAAYRETAEAVMKDEEQYQTTVTTATLELGIDIGRLERAFQIDAPFTVSSFLQRMGRTGRRDLPPEIWFVMREEQPEPRAMLPTTIPWKLLQGIALVQVYLEERWVEPPKLDRLPYSLLYHQTMCTLASCGEMSPAALASRVLTLSYFHRVTQDDFKLLLRHLLETEHPADRDGRADRRAGGRAADLVLQVLRGVSGERGIHRALPFARAGHHLPAAAGGEKIAIAGQVWVVEEVDHKRLYGLRGGQGKVPAYFGQCPGDIHTKILERMRQVLCEETQYPYLMKNAAARRRRGIRRATGVGASRCCGSAAICGCCCPGWEPTSLSGAGALAALRPGNPGADPRARTSSSSRCRPTARPFSACWPRRRRKPLDPMELVYPKELPLFEKIRRISARGAGKGLCPRRPRHYGNEGENSVMETTHLERAAQRSFHRQHTPTQRPAVPVRRARPLAWIRIAGPLGLKGRAYAGRDTPTRRTNAAPSSKRFAERALDAVFRNSASGRR